MLRANREFAWLLAELLVVDDFCKHKQRPIILWFYQYLYFRKYAENLKIAIRLFS